MKLKGIVFIIGTLFCVWSSLLFAAERQAGDTWTEPYSGMEFVYVPGGCFQMGDVFGDGGNETRPVHKVCVDPFYIGKYEVTQGQWRWLMNSGPVDLSLRKGQPRPLFGEGFNYPMYYVSWDNAQEFIRRLSEKSGKELRLPTEAEWEYAARSGGRDEKYSGGSAHDAVAWYGDNSEGMVHPVGLKASNALGLYDMSGNVIEWTGDWYDSRYYTVSSLHNPAGAVSGRAKAFRGGSWQRNARDVTTVFRGCTSPGAPADRETGFRLVLPIIDK